MCSDCGWQPRSSKNYRCNNTEIVLVVLMYLATKCIYNILFIWILLWTVQFLSELSTFVHKILYLHRWTERPKIFFFRQRRTCTPKLLNSSRDSLEFYPFLERIFRLLATKLSAFFLFFSLTLLALTTYFFNMLVCTFVVHLLSYHLLDYIISEYTKILIEEKKWYLTKKSSILVLHLWMKYTFF